MAEETVLAEGYFGVYVGATNTLQIDIGKLPLGSGGHTIPAEEVLKPIHHKVGKLVLSKTPRARSGAGKKLKTCAWVERSGERGPKTATKNREMLCQTRNIIVNLWGQ